MAKLLPSRRDCLRALAAGAFTARGLRSAQPSSSYHRADAEWFAACSFGISTHWTAQSKPVNPDEWFDFEEAVERFDPAGYIGRIAAAGARYVLFTAAHALQMLPAPCAAIDRIAPNRTTKRDLIGEIAQACRRRGLRFILYYNHSCNQGEDAAWERAVGYHLADKRKLVTNLLAIIREIGARYGDGIDAWWFDSCYSLDSRGPFNSVTTDMRGFQFPWEEWSAEAKTGHPGRLVTLSAGMLNHFLYSTHQDYEAGEANDLVSVASSQFTPDGLQAHRWVCLDNPDWVHAHAAKPLTPPRYRLEHVVDYVRTCNRSRVPVTFNIDIEQSGRMSPGSLDLLSRVNDNRRRMNLAFP